jgi:hypothetical protein
MFRIRAAVITILAASSMILTTLAAPVHPQIDDAELVAKLCGKLEQVDSIPNKTLPGNYGSKYRPLKDVKLVAYERHSNGECCANAPVAGETTTDKSGNFEFKGLSKGYYWLVARVELQNYQMSIRIGQLKDKQPVCSQLSYDIDEFGEFVLRVHLPGR